MRVSPIPGACKIGQREIELSNYAILPAGRGATSTNLVQGIGWGQYNDAVDRQPTTLASLACMHHI
jgi:hypothetical protein